MTLIGAFWHVLNFFAPALGISFWASMLAKLVWFKTLRGVPWRPLFLWACSGCTAVLVAGLVIFGNDGKVATYGAMVLACAACLWWRGFRKAG